MCGGRLGCRGVAGWFVAPVGCREAKVGADVLIGWRMGLCELTGGEVGSWTGTTGMMRHAVEPVLLFVKVPIAHLVQIPDPGPAVNVLTSQGVQRPAP